MIKKQIKEIKNPSSRSSKLTDLINEENFDKRLAQQMGMSDDEFEDKIASRDIGSPFPGEPVKATRASEIIDLYVKPTIKKLSDDELDKFNKEMVEYFLNNSVEAQAAAKVFFGRRGL